MRQTAENSHPGLRMWQLAQTGEYARVHAGQKASEMGGGQADTYTKRAIHFMSHNVYFATQYTS